MMIRLNLSHGKQGSLMRHNASLRIFLCGLILGICWLLPAPIEGVWRTDLVACACHPNGLLEFTDENVVRYSRHIEISGPIGKYFRRDGRLYWNATWQGKSIGKWEVDPGWIRIRFVNIETGATFFGLRWSRTVWTWMK